MVVRSPYLGVAACGASAFLDMYATQPLLPEFRVLFGASIAAVGATISALTFACALAAPLAGPVADRLGRKRVIVTAILALAAVTALAATAHSLRELVAWRFTQGVFMPAIFASTVAYVAEEFPAAVAGRGVAAYITGTVSGGFAGRWLTAAVAAHSSWHVAFVVLAVLNIVGAGVVMLTLPRSRRFDRTATIAGAARAMAGFLREPRLVATYVVGGSVLFDIVCAFTYATYHLAAPPFGLGVAALGNVFAVYLLGIAALPIGGRLIDGVGHRTTVLVAVSVSACGALLSLAPAVWAVILGLALISTGVFVAQAASQAFIGVVATTRRSSAAALYLSFYYAGGGLGAVAPAWLWTTFGWDGIVVILLVVQALTGTIAALAWAPARSTSR